MARSKAAQTPEASQRSAPPELFHCFTLRGGRSFAPLAISGVSALQPMTNEPVEVGTSKMGCLSRWFLRDQRAANSS